MPIPTVGKNQMRSAIFTTKIYIFCTHTCTHIGDLAVDWLEDMLYWTNINENKIRRLNLTSTDILATSPDKIQVEGTSVNGSKFRGIVLNPMIGYAGNPPDP